MNLLVFLKAKLFLDPNFMESAYVEWDERSCSLCSFQLFLF